MMNSQFSDSGIGPNLSSVLQSIGKLDRANDALRHERQRLVYNPKTRRFEQVAAPFRPEGALDVTQADLGWGSGLPASPRADVRDGPDVGTLPARDALFSRFGGIVETDALAAKHVLVVGVGSIGSGVAVELAKAGVGHFALLDDDRLEPGNVSRHVSPVSHIGWYKTESVADLLRDKNPYIDVATMEMTADWTTADVLRESVRSSDIVIGGLDSHQGRMVLNRVCLDEGQCLLLPGMRRRAYAGQVLVVRPGNGPCYGCFIAASPESVRDREISTERQASGLAYTDKAVPVEPGLANDVAPVVTMTTKLAIQHLLRDRETTLRSLDEDLVAPLYLWLNRREQDSPFAALPPMGYGVDDLSILRWYGLPLERSPSCPCCGDVPEAHSSLQNMSAIPALTK